MMAEVILAGESIEDPRKVTTTDIYLPGISGSATPFLLLLIGGNSSDLSFYGAKITYTTVP